MSNTFSLNEIVFRDLYESYDAARYHDWLDEESDSELLEPLSETQFKSLINTAFWASLKHEEGRYHNFCLAVIPQDACEHPYVFKELLPFNEESLVKLAPALDPAINFVGLCLGTDDSICIWGLASLDELDNLKIGYEKAFLFCEAIGTGEILLTLTWTAMAVSFFTVLVTGSKTAVIKSANYFKWITDNGEGKRIADLLPSDIRQASDYKVVAKAMRSHQHGGTLLIVKKDSDWSKSIRQPIYYEGKGHQAVYDISARNTIFDENKSTPYKLNTAGYRNAKEIATGSLNAIGRLTAVDGATIITQEFDVLAFGAKIEAKSKPEKLLKLTPFENDTPTEVKLSDLGGTRHQSAAQFVLEQKDAVAIVVSQDGRISILKWNAKDSLVCIMRSLEYAFY